MPSVFDMAATEDFLNSIRSELRGRRGVIGIVAMRVDPRTRAAVMLEEFLRHFDIPILAYLQYTELRECGCWRTDSVRSATRRNTVAMKNNGSPCCNGFPD